MSGLPWFKVYVAETLSDERFQGWSVEERGAWFTLLLVAWREGSIPSDQTSLAKLLHVDGNTMRLLWSGIGDRFIEHPDHSGRLTSPRLEMEREAAEKMVEKRASAGQKGATSRWAKEKRRHGKRIALLSDRNATPMANDSEPEPESDVDQSQPTVSDDRIGPEGSGLAGSEVEGFRRDLGERLGVDLKWGANRDGTSAAFTRHLAAVGHDTLLADCLEIARRSRSGTPSSLGFFVGWLDRLPMRSAR